WPYHYSLHKGREGLMSEVLGSRVLVDRGAQLRGPPSSAKMLSPGARLRRSAASGGAQVGWTCLSSGRSSIPARRSGRVGSRRDPSDGQVSSVVDFAIPLLRRGVGAFIATVTGYSYLNPLSSLLFTIPLHLAMSSVVLAARRASAAE
ncbi:hypothetical protein GW17_00056121, partial [Ensete ventricosum]